VTETLLERPAAPLLPSDLDTPAALIDLEVVRANITAMQRLASAAGVRLRPHVKTHKSVEIGRLQLAAGASGITAGTVGEAEVFAKAGFDDIFIAYPVWAGGPRGRRVRALHEAIRLRVGLDGARAADALATAVAGTRRPLEVLIEVDCGAGRSGVRPADAGDLARYAATLGLLPIGAFTYPGHGDASRDAREPASRDEVHALEMALASLRAAGLTPTVASAGSTPTAAFSGRPPVTELRPGEYVFNDVGKLRIGACGPGDLGLFVASTVVSDAVPDQVIVDAGTKTLGREGSETLGYGLVPAVRGGFLRRLNEYHGYLSVDRAEPRPKVGDVVAIAPNHVCPVVNLFDELIVHEGRQLLDRWPVDARGHLG
jgi:D-serine deaminase-like pyridoxal phosphate-dependent protein